MTTESLCVAVTGGTGMLGGAVLDELLARGHTVRALVRPRSGRVPNPREGITWIEGALDDAASLDALVRSADAICHLAFSAFEEPPPVGRSIAEHFVQTNVVGTLRLIERTPATRLGQMLFASTLAVFGENPHLLPGADRLPLDEDFPVWPAEFYGGHKAALEKLVLAAAGAPGMNASAWRIGCVLGHYPDRGRDPLAPIVDDAQEHGEIRTRKGAYVVAARDVARCMADALGDATVRGGIYHVFDRWLDFTTLDGLLSEILDRPIGRATEAAPPPCPALSNARLRARGVQFGTETELPALLRRLLAADDA
ncbi:MAG: NAD-dependent epimerase/dehydratase family protein [Planctomycetota bacterium]